MSRPRSKVVRLRVTSTAVHGALAEGWLQEVIAAEASHVVGASEASTTDTSTLQLPVAEPARAIDAVLLEHSDSRAPQEAWFDIQGWLHQKGLTRQASRAGDPDPDAQGAAVTLLQPASDAHTKAIDAVLGELATRRALRGAWFDIVLADSLVQLDVARGDFAGDSDRQLQSVAEACVAELLGDAAPIHEVRWKLQPDGEHLLIAAIARSQLRALAEAAERHGLRLRSVQPDFCLQWSQHGATLKGGSAVFAVACDEEAVIACVADGVIVDMSSGGWVDRPLRLDEPPSPGDQFMSGFGLDPDATTNLLDRRCNRLLASVGQDPSIQSAFVLVAPAISKTAASSRWTVLGRSAPIRTAALSVDFAPRTRRAAWLPWAMPTLAATALAAAAIELTLLLSGNARLLERLAESDRRRRLVISAPAQAASLAPADLARTRAVRQVAQKLVTPWSDLLESLETTPRQAVALLSIEPSVSRHSVRLTAEARSLPDMLSYLGALQKDPRLSAVVLLTHQVQTEAPGAPVRFQIQAGWGSGT